MKPIDQRNASPGLSQPADGPVPVENAGTGAHLPEIKMNRLESGGGSSLALTFLTPG